MRRKPASSKICSSSEERGREKELCRYQTTLCDGLPLTVVGKISQAFTVILSLHGEESGQVQGGSKEKTWLQIVSFPLITTDNWRGVEPWGAVRGHFSEEVILV